MSDKTTVPKKSTDNQIDADLDRDYAEAWRPSPGDKLVGVVVDISARDGSFGRYPIVTVRTAEGEELAIHAFHEVLAGELARIAPKVGDEIGVKYQGKHERGYHKYRATRAGSTAEIDWSEFTGDGTTESDAPAAHSGLHAPLEVDEADAQLEAAREAAESEIPF